MTNTTKESMTTLQERLRKLGFDIQISEIFSSLTAAKNVVLKNQYRPYLLLSESAKKDFEGEHNISVVVVAVVVFS